MSAPALIPPDLLAMIARGVSVNVGSRDAALRPSVMRAMASDVSGDGRTITVYLARRQSEQLLLDIGTTGRIAVMFSEPSTNRTVQVKASRAETRNAVASDEAVLQRYLQSMEVEIERVGYRRELTRAMLACRLDDLVAVSFTPEQVFEQTPGPRAGQLMAGKA